MLSENEIRDQDSAFANASLSCSSRDSRVNARPRGCALRRAESGCEFSRGSFNRGGNEKRSRATRRRVAGNANHAIRKHATIIEHTLAMSRRLGNERLRTISRVYGDIKQNRFYEDQHKEGQISCKNKEYLLKSHLDVSFREIWPKWTLNFCLGDTFTLYDANVVPLYEI